jgi:hypothetical protein
MAYDWTMFFDEFAGDFHPTFQKELSRQLFDKGTKGTGINQFDKYDFQLMVGMKDLYINLVDNKIYAKIDFITPTSFSFPVQIYWYSDNFSNLLELHKQDITNINVVFNWADNFPLQHILPHIRPYRVDEKAKTNLNFDVEYFYYLLPDISLQFHFAKSLDNDEIKSLDNFLSSFNLDWNVKNKGKEIQFISNMTEIGNNVYEVVTDIGLTNSIKTITNFIKSYSDNFVHLQTTKISIR